MIEIKQADRNNFCETSMDAFDRAQEVQNVWRMENGRLVLKFQPFSETWSPEQRRKNGTHIIKEYVYASDNPRLSGRRNEQIGTWRI